jgi:hypothetical protein
MPDVNLQLVREFFELNLFHILTNWGQEPWKQHTADYSAQLFVENTAPTPDAEPPFRLAHADLSGIERAVVEVRAWHADRVYPSVIESNPVLSQFAGEPALALANEVFRGNPYRTILVISELPATAEQRDRSIQLLQDAGIQHVLEFPTLLRGILDAVDVNENYSGSTTLQTLRLLKRYELIRHQQMEFLFHSDAPAPRVTAPVETVVRDEE